MAFHRTSRDRTQMMRGVVRSLSRIASIVNARFRQPERAGISSHTDISKQPLARQGGGLLSFQEAF
jgi:hypothetical protein